MIESEGITENVDPWRTDVSARFIDEIGMEKLMFEAADPDVFAWYVKNYGAEVICSSITARSCSWNVCAAASGEPKVCGEGLTYKDTTE